MSSLKEFRGAADEVMSEIIATDALKEKVLLQCMKKKHVPITEFLAMAACFVIIIGIVSVYGMLPLNNFAGEDRNSNINLMADSGDNTIPDHGAIKKWLLKTPDEAKKSFGNFFIAPSYIPESFKLDKIHASGTNENTAAKVILSYTCNDQSFLIIEEKTELQNGFNNYETIDINGATGYLKPDASDESGSTVSPDIELHWFADGVHYSIAGLITGDEAVRVARSMK